MDIFNIAGSIHSTSSEHIVVPASEISVAAHAASGLLAGKLLSVLETIREGKADLIDGKVPASQLPSFVDEIIEGYLHDNHFYQEDTYTNLVVDHNNVSADRLASKIYVDIDTNISYRWGTTEYVEINTQQGKIDALSIGTTPGHLVAWGANGHTVTDSGITVGTNVPADAKFTDTTYENLPAFENGTDVSLVETGEKYIWNNKYDKPSGGIPKTDLSSAVNASLLKADTALQASDIAGKADASDLTSHVENSNIHVSSSDKTAWNSKYLKPTGGIPKTDLSSEVLQMLEASGEAEFAVLYSAGQQLTDTQKTNALNNIDSRAYNAASFSGKGKVYLQKNVTSVTEVSTFPSDVSAYEEGEYIHVTFSDLYYQKVSGGWQQVAESDARKNILTQAMISSANTVYVILYDYELEQFTSENVNLNFTSSQVSEVKTHEKADLDNAISAYNAAVNSYNAAVTAYEENLTDNNLFTVTVKEKAVEDALDTKNEAQAAFEAINSLAYYYWYEYTIPAKHYIKLDEHSYSLNNEKDTLARLEDSRGIIYAPYNESRTVYIGSTEGSHSYITREYFNIPEWCTLVFDGGSINGIVELVLNHTTVEAEDYLIFRHGEVINKGNLYTCNGDLTSNITGTVTNEQLSSDWFGCVANGESGSFGVRGIDQTSNIQFAINTAANLSTTLYLSPKRTPYLVENTIYLPRYLSIYGLNHTETGWTITTECKSMILFSCKYLFRRKKDTRDTTEQLRIRQVVTMDMRFISFKGLYSRGDIPKWDSKNNQWTVQTKQAYRGDPYWIKKTYVFYGFNFARSTLYGLTTQYIGTFLYGTIYTLTRIEKCKIFYHRHFINGAKGFKLKYEGENNETVTKYITSHRNYTKYFPNYDGTDERLYNGYNYFDKNEFGEESSYNLGGTSPEATSSIENFVGGTNYYGYEEPIEPYLGDANSSADSYIINNYISGSNTRCVAFYGVSGTTLFVYDNFFEFAFVLFESTTLSGTIRTSVFSRNIFDYCFVIWHGYEYNVSITDNLMRSCKRDSIMNRKDNIFCYWFDNDYTNEKQYDGDNYTTDSDVFTELDHKSIIIYPAFYSSNAMRGFNVSNNIFSDCEKMFRNYFQPIVGCNAINIADNTFEGDIDANCNWVFRKSNGLEGKNINIESSGSGDDFEYEFDEEYNIFNPNCVSGITYYNSIFSKIYGSNGLVHLSTSYSGDEWDFSTNGYYYDSEKVAYALGVIIDFNTEKSHTIRFSYKGTTVGGARDLVFAISMNTWDNTIESPKNIDYIRSAIDGSTGRSIPEGTVFQYDSTGKYFDPYNTVLEDCWLEITVPANVKSLGLCFQNLHTFRVQFSDGAIRYKTHENGKTGDAVFTIGRPSSSDLYIGFKVYDVDIDKTICWNGTTWVDEKGFTATSNKGSTLSRPTGIGGGGVLDDTRDIGFEYFDTDLGVPVYASAIAVDGTVTWKTADLYTS